MSTLPFATSFVGVCVSVPLVFSDILVISNLKMSWMIGRIEDQSDRSRCSLCSSFANLGTEFDVIGGSFLKIFPFPNSKMN